MLKRRVQSRPGRSYAAFQASAPLLGAERRRGKVSTPVAVLAVFITCLSQPAGAYQTNRHHHVSRPVSLDVQPRPEIDARVAEEVARARKILDDLNTDNFLASPYLVSAIYHDGLLTGFPVDRSSAAPERRIIGQIINITTLSIDIMV